MFKPRLHLFIGFALAFVVTGAQVFAPTHAIAQASQPVNFSLRSVDGGAISSEMLTEPGYTYPLRFHCSNRLAKS